jgi:serine-type D-Ala-D-Ala carboxypeptidase/endopeptidase (penicillin-binding protein 4)
MRSASGSPCVSRRLVLGGLAATAISTRPFGATAGIPTAVSRLGLGDQSGVAVAEVRSGTVLDAHRPEAGLPPASVLKIMTALYALEALGADYRFRTCLRTTGPVNDRRLAGDLVLVGGGDPVLDTDALKHMAQLLAARGIGEVQGRFLVAQGALPFVELVDLSQPPHVGYNPAISGINLNFNRVKVAWAPGKSGPGFGFSAPGRGFEVTLGGIGGEIGAGQVPVYRREGAHDHWSMPGPRMKGKGSLWLPVRRPAAYAGEVFRELSAREGLALPEPEVVGAAPEGVDIVTHESPRLDDILRGLLKYSTNLTAEIIGLRASQARGDDPEGLFQSAAAMTVWARERYGLSAASFMNHSGLSDRSVWPAGETVRVLAAEAGGPLPHLLHSDTLHDEEGRPLRARDVRVAAKTGTLYFASGLAGYIETRDRQLAFAIYSSDQARRAEITIPASEPPPGARAWAGRARRMQRALLREWAGDYLPPPVLRPMPRRG